ncbi:MAG: hypothetical protein VW122_13020, partial [Paracoccaceae bacterium]
IIKHKLHNLRGKAHPARSTVSHHYNSRSALFVARMKSLNWGCGSKGSDFSSGCNFTPTNDG